MENVTEMKVLPLLPPVPTVYTHSSFWIPPLENN